MAIYTNYGRYLKARQFKEMLEEQGDTYMLFGLGNPQWDNTDSNQNIPIAPYNAAIMKEGSTDSNQFFDDTASVYFGTTSAMVHGSIDPWDAPDSLQQLYHNYTYLTRNIIPPFPCIFSPNDSTVDQTIFTVDSIPVKQSNYQNYCIKKSDGSYYLYNVSNLGNAVGVIPRPADDSLAIQYFVEMYIRGRAYTAGITNPPVGLLGAIKCNIELAKDIGGEGSNLYTGSINQFWYGDRYWQTVNPDENEAISINSGYIEAGESHEINQDIYPHHLIFTATVSPRLLCEELNIDQYIVPRQIAIYTKKRKPVLAVGDSVKDIKNYGTNNSPLIMYEDGPLYYRAYENIFDFGQYHESVKPGAPGYISGWQLTYLSLSLKCNLGTSTAESTLPGPSHHYAGYTHYTYNGDFKFILNDYIKGHARERHSADRFGYVVGF